MRFVVGCNLEDFKSYYDTTLGRLDEVEEYWVSKNPSHLIVWEERGRIIGHAIWHETDTEEHRKGDLRDREDREILQKLLGGKKSFIELHEIWLKEEYRGKGYGKMFFEYFEEFVRAKGYNQIVFYAYHPAAIAICRKRGYREAYGLRLAVHGGGVQTCFVFCLSLKAKKD